YWVRCCASNAEVVCSIPTGPMRRVSVSNPQPLSKDHAEHTGHDGPTHRGEDRGHGRAESERRGRREKSDEIPRRPQQASEPHDQEREEERPDEERRHQDQRQNSSRVEENFWGRAHRRGNPQQQRGFERRNQQETQPPLPPHLVRSLTVGSPPAESPDRL